MKRWVFALVFTLPFYVFAENDNTGHVTGGVIHLTDSLEDDLGEYPRAQERKTLLANYERVKTTEIDVIVEDQFEGAFEQTFAEGILPLLFEIKRQDSLYAILHVAVDRALYNDEPEMEEWERLKKTHRNKKESLLASSAFKEELKIWANLAEGLEGELPDLARRLAKEDELRGFTSEQMPLVEKLTELEQQINKAANESKVTGKMLSEYQKVHEQIEKDFRAGKIGFDQATLLLDENWAKGFHAKGHDVATTAYEALNEMARVRTELARSKGYDTWAQYQLSTNIFTHKEGLQTPEEHIEFLSKVLKDTLPAYLAFKEWTRAQHPEIDPNKIDGRNSFLLLPESDTILSHYFPVENVEKFWIQTMLESGFDQSYINDINLDSFPRENKQTHAYMYPVVSQLPKVVRVKNKSLIIPPADRTNWNPAVIYIVQNARKDGLDAYSTVFHEGGHGLDFASRLNMYDHPFEESSEAYAYAETASMTMERFFADKDFLLAKGLSREGEKPSEAEVNEYLKNFKLLDALGRRGQVRNALFDLMIWNEAYTEDSTPLVDRMQEIYQEMDDNYFPSENETPLPEGVAAGDRMFATNHFYSGNVRYYGYIYADMASQMTADYLWDVLEHETGRRTFLNQPLIAELLVPDSYSRGFSVPFPQTTENLTGMRFKPRSLIEYINSTVDSVVGESCEALLNE